VDLVVAERMADFPAVSLIGPRASGKTTTAARLAGSVLRLDDPGQAAVVRANPDAALRDLAEPVLIDEWQEAPEVLGALKRTVDLDPRPGRFLLTGSVRAELQGQVWPGTGRVVHVPMTTLSVREQLGDARAAPLIERVIRSGSAELRVPRPALDVRDYVRLALVGGFPEPALRLPARARAIWLDSYVQQLVTRDVQVVDPARDPLRVRRFFDVLAMNTAGVIANKTLYRAADINRVTAEAYERLLRNLFVIDAVPAWFDNRMKRLLKTPKRYLIDAGLAAAAISVDEAAVMRDAHLLGRLLDTFVTAQLRAELEVSTSRPRLHHLRTEGGRREIDLLLELSGQRVIGIEIKAAAAVDHKDARHLEWLRDELGERFVHGLVLHAGPGAFELSRNITAAPIGTLWS
jgi:predicted AAA+ superfamily ATPase